MSSIEKKFKFFIQLAKEHSKMLFKMEQIVFTQKRNKSEANCQPLVTETIHLHSASAVSWMFEAS